MRHNLKEIDWDGKTAVCSVCGPTDIYIRPGTTRRECGTKRRADKRNYVLRNPLTETQRAARREWQRKYQATDRGRAYQQDYQRMYLYGITQDDFNQMWSDQGGKCAICHEAHEMLVTDHCHATGRVRGLLCRNCNFGLGHFRDDPASLLRAIEYLR